MSYVTLWVKALYGKSPSVESSFMNGDSSLYVNTHAKFTGQMHCGSGDEFYNVT